jgi:hypothetical protein
LRPAAATNTPASTSSSVNRSIAANASSTSGVGAMACSVVSPVIANTMTRIVKSPCLSRPLLASHRERRTSLSEIDSGPQIFLGLLG